MFLIVSGVLQGSGRLTALGTQGRTGKGARVRCPSFMKTAVLGVDSGPAVLAQMGSSDRAWLSPVAPPPWNL